MDITIEITLGSNWTIDTDDHYFNSLAELFSLVRAEAEENEENNWYEATLELGYEFYTISRREVSLWQTMTGYVLESGLTEADDDCKTLLSVEHNGYFSRNTTHTDKDEIDALLMALKLANS